MLEHLIERSKRHPVPHAWLAKWHVIKVQQGWFEDMHVEAKLALDCTKQALDSEPNNSLALTIDGFVHTNLLKELDIGAARYSSALEVNPNESLAWLLKGTLHAFKGEGQVAAHDTERALKLSPLDPIRYFYDSLAATAALSAGDYVRAMYLARRSLRANKTHTSTLRALIISLVQCDQIEEAKNVAKELLKLEPDFSISKFSLRTPASGSKLGEIATQSFRAVGIPN
jgi:adenylate cyclase